MTVTCPKCGVDLGLPDDAAGAKVKCSECGEKFVAPVQQIPIDAECPHCHTVYEVTREELGSNVQCEQCNKMFIVKKKPFQKGQSKESGSLKVCEISISELSQRAMYIMERSKEVAREKEAVALRDELLEIKNEIVRRYEIAKSRAIETSRQNVPFLLKPFSCVFVNFRTMPEDEIYLQKLASKMALSAREIMRHTNAVVQQDRVRQKKIAEEERKRAEEERMAREKIAAEERRKREEAEIAIYKDDITKCVQKIRENKRLDPICYDYFSCQVDEVIYFVSKDVTCVIPNQRRDKFDGGTFVITNKRIVYTSEQHIQAYRIKNIRDFKPCWRLGVGWITIGTSDKRKERYKLNAIWLPTLLILFVANDVFKEKLLTQDASVSVETIWNKVMSTFQYLRSGLFDCQGEQAPGRALDAKVYFNLTRAGYIKHIQMLLACEELPVEPKCLLEHILEQFENIHETYPSLYKAVTKYRALCYKYNFDVAFEEWRLPEIY